jgi:wyosine [tRNA(Phe)-imidazoG37] synthetase (radical SAM superfamily)
MALKNVLKKVIICRAGINTNDDLEIIKERGINPICFCVTDSKKHESKLFGLPVYNLEYAKVNVDGMFYVLEEYPKKNEILDLLLQNGVNRNRIINFIEMERRLGCGWLDGAIRLRFNHETYGELCFLGTPDHDNSRTIPDTIPLNNDFAKFTNDLLNLKKRVIHANNNGVETFCTGCDRLVEGYFVKDINKIRQLNFELFVSCNCRCIYCFNFDKIPPHEIEAITQDKLEVRKKFDFIKYIEFLGENGYIDSETRIELVAGEITIDPDCDKLLDVVNPYKVTIYTNGIIYNEKIAELISRPRSFLNVSIDSGNCETFKKIKGVDAFERVRKNLLKYKSRGGNIEIKYIRLGGINDDDENLYGFLDLCNLVQPQKIILNHDFRDKNSQDKYFDFDMKFCEVMIKNGHRLSLPFSFQKKYKEFVKGSLGL